MTTSPSRSTHANPTTTPPLRYHGALVALHWLLALAIVLMLVLGTFVTAATPNSDPEKLNHLRGHMIMGMVILVLMLVRLVVRKVTAHPAPVASNTPLENRLAALVHGVLYLLVFVMLGSGIAMSVMTGLPAIVFGGTGALPASFDHLTPRAVHGLAATTLMLAIAAHVGAALWHVVVKKDGLLKRMWFGCK